MVGFIDEQIEECPKQPTKLNPLGSVDHTVIDLSIADTFFDFDSMENWFQDYPNPDGAISGDAEGAVKEKMIQMVEGGYCGETRSEGAVAEGSQPHVDGSKQKEVDVSVPAVKSEPEELATERTSSYCIADEIDKVDLVQGLSSVLVPCDKSIVKSEAVSDVGKSKGKGDDEGESSSETESESSSSSSSSEDDDDEDDGESSSASSSSEDEEVDIYGDEEEDDKKKMNVHVKALNEVREFEEGEIRDDDGERTFSGSDKEELVNDDKDGKDMVSWSDVEFDDADNEDGGAASGPIRSKNELQDLPPVPRVEVGLQPHHQLQPVGAVLSIIGAKVIVEGFEKHNPLDDGSILWVTKSRSTLGQVDEIFGPVKNPYYVIRYNSESEVPEGICEGSLISFVQDFASHVLNDKNLYKKGYDASGENDEELSEDVEFSDDEKEAEYRRRLKMSKRGMDELKIGNKKNDRRKLKNREGTWKHHMAVGQQSTIRKDHLPPIQNQSQILPVATSTNQGNGLSLSATRPDFPNSMSWAPSFQQMAQTTAGFPPSNGMGINGMPLQNSQSAAVPAGFPTHFMPWPAQNHLGHPHQMPIAMEMPFQQAFNPIPGSLPNFGLPGGHPNMFPCPVPNTVPGLVGQNCFGQTGFGMSFQGQLTGPCINIGERLSSSNGVVKEEQNSASQPSAIPTGSSETAHQFNVGANSSRGRGGYRWGGRFRGGRGRRQPR